VERTITAIAQDDKVVIFDTSVLPESSKELLKNAREIVRSVHFARKGNPGDIEKTIELLKMKMKNRRLLRPQQQGKTSDQGVKKAELMTAGASTVGTPVHVQAGVGELEITASSDASNVVIASNGGLSFSTNRGVSFSTGTTGVFGLNDPSLARGASGNFYLDVIATPTGTQAQLNVKGCTNAVSRSTNQGASFTLQGYSARCPSTGAICFPDQEHMAGDTRNAANGGDQLYAVWRNFTPASSVATCNGIGGGYVTSSITCSQNNGSNWTARTAIPGAGDFPRVAVGRDGSVFVVTVSGNLVLLNRFSSCASGLKPVTGFPVTVATLIGGVTCSVSGLDRCNNGNVLSSPVVAPDPGNANHLFVTFAENNGGTGERIVAMESNDRGKSFPIRKILSDSTSARRFMPWSCSTRGGAWIGWYDRGAATNANNDLTDYVIASTSGTHWKLSGNPDPQCASGWPCAPRSSKDSETCSVQPQLAGVCRNAAGGGSKIRCDFSAGGCPAGETCKSGGGCPKYGDYNGIACGGNFVVAAWASATASPGQPAATGLGVYSKTLYIARDGAAIWRYTGTPCNGNSCPGWERFDNNPRTVTILADVGNVYQLHNNGAIWQSSNMACDADSCPGWRALDKNPKTIAVAAAGGKLYQLHNDGKIWRYTGTPCSGNSCPGWQKLDGNTKTVAIAAGGGNLYQLHNDGWIWRFTGTPCSGNSCPGWQRLDNNSKAIGITAAGDDLYQLHNDGWIWRYTGTPCSGNSCPGWQKLDNNSRTGMIAAGNALYQLHTDPLYQLHNDGGIWRYTGQECEGDFCPGWERLDNNIKTRSIVAAGRQLFQLHNDGKIWRHTGKSCNGDKCPGWQMIDKNPKTVSIASAGAQLFQLHNDGMIWRWTGRPCKDNGCPGWQRLDNNHRTVAIAAGGNQLFQLHNDGRIWRYTGKPCSGNSCTGWQLLDINLKTESIVAGNNQLFQLHNDGMIWRWTGRPCKDNSCPGWQKLDNNPRTKEIAASGNQLVQLHNNGSIWRYTGTPCKSDSCPGWQKLDSNGETREIAVSGSHIYQRHGNGRIYRYTGPGCSGNRCPGWRLLDNNSKTRDIAVGGFN
jgi:hypothetical protein